ncbi:hypothetical protein AAVH_38913, partial [Aphelenchoides avenae]
LAEDPKTCVLLIRDNAGTDDEWILGTSFLRTSCHAFDFDGNRVGFASFA